ncbi:MAG: hypothetical protein ACLVAK_09685 [Clostridia bacterium]
MENEELKNENVENEEVGMAIVQDFSALQRSTNTKVEMFTNITDQKKIFNLDTHVDNLLNDCEGELIRVKEVLVKRYKKPMKEPIVDEETGEVLKDTETTMACILIDDNGKSYATGSKVFTIQMMRYLQMFGITDEGFEIRIVKNKTDKGNKSLGFELV